MKIGYATVFASDQDRVDQVKALMALGVPPDDIYTDRSRVGAPQSRPGRDEALARCSAGDVFVVTSLERLAHSITDACTVSRHLDKQGTSLAVGNVVYDPRDEVGSAMFTALDLLGEFEASLFQIRARDGFELARAKGTIPGRGPKLNDAQAKNLLERYRAGSSTMNELAAEFETSRSTIYRTLRRLGAL